MSKMIVERAVLQEVLESLKWYRMELCDGRRPCNAEQALEAELAEPVDPDPWGAGYEAGYEAGVARGPAQPVQAPVQDADLWSAGYQAGYAAGMEECPAEPAQEPAEFAVSSNGRHSPVLTAMMNARRRAEAAEPAQEPYTGDVTRIMREAGMTFHLGLPQKRVVEQMTRVIDLVYAEASIKAAQQFAASPPQAAQPVQKPVQEPEWEVRADGKRVRKDRWQIGIRRIVALIWGNRREFEIDEVVEAVRGLASAERTLKRLGYTDCGGQFWKPPLGAPAQPFLPPDAETAWTMGYEAGKCEANGVLDPNLPPSPVKPVGIVSHLVKGDVVWQRWPADMPDGTRLWGEVQP